MPTLMDFDQAFDDFLSCPEYDKAEADLFSVIYLAFKAGWLAAGGTPLKPIPVIQLVPKSAADEKKDE